MPLKEKNINMYKTKAQNSANFNKNYKDIVFYRNLGNLNFFKLFV